MIPVATIADLEVALVLPESEKLTIDWDSISEETKHWVAGMMDGDGTVCADIKHGLRVAVKQAELGWETLTHLMSIFGGAIYDNKAATSRTQAQRTWHISGRNALSFCDRMLDYVHLKKPQLKAAQNYPVNELKFMQMMPVVGIHKETGCVKMYGSTQFAAKCTPRAHASNILKCINDSTLTSGSHYWNLAKNPVKVLATKKNSSTLFNSYKS